MNVAFLIGRILLMVPLSGSAIVAGGLSVALGIWADLGALVLAAFALVGFYAYNQLQGEAGLSITDPVFSRGE